MLIDEELAQKFGISGHQKSYLNTFLQVCEIRGRHILEVGGAMPGDLVIGHLGAESWTSVQSKDYELLRDDNQIPRPNGFDGQYKVIYRNIEELGSDAYFQDRFDFIFSIACFEHLHKLPEALLVL